MEVVQFHSTKLVPESENMSYEGRLNKEALIVITVCWQKCGDLYKFLNYHAAIPLGKFSPSGIWFEN